MGTPSRSDGRASCPAPERTSQARKGWPWGIQLRQLRRGRGQEARTEGVRPLVPSYSRLLGADFAAPGAVGAVGTAVLTHQVVAAPASVGLGADAAQALLAAGTRPLAVALAAPLGSLAPDLQQLILQAPAQTRHQELSEPPRDPGGPPSPPLSLIHPLPERSGEQAPAQPQPHSHLILLSSALRSSSSRCRTCRIRSLSTSDRKDRSTASDIAPPGMAGPHRLPARDMRAAEPGSRPARCPVPGAGPDRGTQDTGPPAVSTALPRAGLGPPASPAVPVTSADSVGPG